MKWFIRGALVVALTSAVLAGIYTGGYYVGQAEANRHALVIDRSPATVPYVCARRSAAYLRGTQHGTIFICDWDGNTVYISR